MKKIALIDADSIVYRAGFAGETRSLQATYEDAEGELHTRGFVPDEKLGTAAAQLKKFLADNKCELIDKTDRIDPDPIEHVLHTVKVILVDIMFATGADSRVVYLTGKENFRDKIATIRPYKGNRDKLSRPFHYDAIRAYLIREQDAIVIEGEEADDAISIRARQEVAAGSEYIVCSIDKDLDQVPGKHYDFLKKINYDVRDDEAEFVFYRQCLSGDSVDNVPGCYKMGQVKAEKLLQATERKDWWSTIVRTYEASKAIAGCPYADKSAIEVAIETAVLVRMRVFPNEFWMPTEAQQA